MNHKVVRGRKGACSHDVLASRGGGVFFFFLSFISTKADAVVIDGWEYERNTTSTEECQIDETKCDVNRNWLGDGYCRGGKYNTIESCYDGGDCIEFNKKYPNCKHVGFPGWIGDGWCHVGENYNTEECGFDGGDCFEFNQNYPNCTVDYPAWIGNGDCHGGEYNTKACGFDGGDCIEFNEKYPNCNVDFPFRIGNGYCHVGEYNTEACGWDGGDCLVEGYPDCHVDYLWMIGNGECNNWGEYNTKECGFDGGDCIVFNEKYPNCNVDYLSLIGNGWCNGGEYNTEECKWDGGDCIISIQEKYPDCILDDYSKIGNGRCDREYNFRACGWDDGDCLGSGAKAGIPNGARVGIIISILFFSFAAYTTYLYINHRHRQRRNGIEQRRRTDEDILQSAPMMVMNEQEPRMDRHTLVLTSIIHKKVISSTKSNNNHDDEVNILPHEAIIPERSTRIQLLKEEANEEEGENKRMEEIEAQQSILQQKNNIMVETLRSIRAMNNAFNLSSAVEISDDNIYNPKMCPICCDKYVKGDDIAWSKNEECAHAFHTDCIVPWLIEHNDCPMCRNDYLCQA